MATYRAIEAAAAAVAGLLGDAARAGDLESEELAFEVIGAADLTDGRPSGAGVLVHRVAADPSRVQRSDPADLDPRRQGPQPLSVEVHLLVVVSAADARDRLALTGWIMRTLEEHPVLPAHVLNLHAGRAPVFAGEETARLTFEHLANEELLHLRDGLGAAGCDVVPLPYVVSGLRLEVGNENAPPRRGDS